MRRRLVAGLIAAVAALASSPAHAQDLRVLMKHVEIAPVTPVRPPDFALPGLDGTRMALADLKGRPALLYFWATW